MTKISSNFNKEVHAPKDLKDKEQIAVFIGFSDEQVQKMTYDLNQHFDLLIKSFDRLEKGLDHILEFKTTICLINENTLGTKCLGRIIEVINFTQIPTLFISESHLRIKSEKQLEVPKSHPFIMQFEKTNQNFIETINKLMDNTGTLVKLNHRMMKASTGQKPKTFYYLAALLFIEPILKVLYMKFSTGFDFEVIFRTILSMEGFLSNFEFWLMFPLAGVVLILEKSWSLLFFCLIQVYCLFSFFFYVEFTWPYVADSPHLSSKFLLFLNTSIILYFIVPENRRPYWNKSHKLWRNTSRYATNLPVYFSTAGNKLSSIITNISESGAYFTSSENLPIGEETNLSFIIDGKVQTINAVIRRTHPIDDKNVYGYGVEFLSLEEEDKDSIREYIGSLNTKIQ